MLFFRHSSRIPILGLEPKFSFAFSFLCCSTCCCCISFILLIVFFFHLYIRCLFVHLGSVVHMFPKTLQCCSFIVFLSQKRLGDGLSPFHCIVNEFAVSCTLSIVRTHKNNECMFEKVPAAMAFGHWPKFRFQARRLRNAAIHKCEQISGAKV